MPPNLQVFAIHQYGSRLAQVAGTRSAHFEKGPRRWALTLGITLLLVSCAWLASPAPGWTQTPGDQDSDCSRPLTDRPPIADGQFEQLLSVRIAFDNDVPARDRVAIRTAVLATERFFQEKLGLVLGNACVDVYARTDRQPGKAAATGNQVAIFTSPDGWPNLAPWHLTLVTAHELVHVWQSALAGEYSGSEPAWLVEGAAETIALEVMVTEGILSPGEAAERSAAPSGPFVPPLKAIESYAVINGVVPQYRLAQAAVRRLIEPFGVDALGAFWTRLGSGAGWQSAFVDTFGLTPDAFYAAFDASLRRPG